VWGGGGGGGGGGLCAPAAWGGPPWPPGHQPPPTPPTLGTLLHQNSNNRAFLRGGRLCLGGRLTCDPLPCCCRGCWPWRFSFALRRRFIRLWERERWAFVRPKKAPACANREARPSRVTRAWAGVARLEERVGCTSPRSIMRAHPPEPTGERHPPTPGSLGTVALRGSHRPALFLGGRTPSVRVPTSG
jgi:hypothetical protein